MSSAPHAKTWSKPPVASQPGRMASQIFLTYLPICLTPLLLLAGLVFWVGRSFIYQIAPVDLAAPVVTSIALILLAAVLLTGLLTLLVAWRAARRITAPFSGLIASLQMFLAGNPDQRATLPHNTRSASEAAQLVNLFNQMADEYRSTYQLLSRRDLSQKDTAFTHDQAVTQVMQAAADVKSLDELLQVSLQVILEDFSCLQGAIYLLEQKPGAGGNQPKLATLARSGRASGFESQLPGAAHPQPITGDSGSITANTDRTGTDGFSTPSWLVNQAIASRRSQVDHYQVASVPEDEGEGAEGQGDDLAPGSLEAAIPIFWGEEMLGVLDLISSDPRKLPSSPFSSRSLADLHKIAAIIALGMAALSPKPPVSAATEDAQPLVDGQAVTQANTLAALLAFQASKAISRAETQAQALEAVTQALDKSPYPVALLMAESFLQTVKQQAARPHVSGAPEIKLFYISAVLSEPQISHSETEKSLEGAQSQEPPISFSVDELTACFSDHAPFLINDLSKSSLLYALPPKLKDYLVNTLAQPGYSSAVLAPIWRDNQLAAVLILGGKQASEFIESRSTQTAGRPPSTIFQPSPGQLAPYLHLVESTITALENLANQTSTQHKLAELQILADLSQVISSQTDLNQIYQIIHRQLEGVMGGGGGLSSFAIALNDPASETIRIPYLYEDGALLQIPSFPMGKGLTSIVLRSRKPLLLVENVEEQSNALGAIEAGAPAKSWLGVPMICAGEVIGAIIVQDIHQAGRFDEDDQSLLSTMATQVAVVVRNARLMETMQRQANQERYLNEITARIRRAPDIQSILKTTAEELGAALDAGRLHIRIGAAEPTAPAETRPPGAARPGLSPFETEVE